MKYYIYISDAKVDMLLPQVPHEVKRKIAVDFGFDFGGGKASRKTETESDESRISRLETVLSYIREYGNVGSIDKPDEFIDDVQTMCFGVGSDNEIVYFTGKTDQTAFVLAGSTRHLIGSRPKESSSGWGGSLMSQIELWLRREWTGQQAGESFQIFNSALGVLREYWSNDTKQRLEVFAKRLAFNPTFVSPLDEEGYIPVLIASPLYIAMMD